MEKVDLRDCVGVTIDTIKNQCEAQARFEQALKKEDRKKSEKKKKKSHNVYYPKDKYRIRIYRNDKKIYEKQAVIHKLSYNSISREIITILREFISKITLKEDMFELYDSEYINALNKATYLGQLIEKLRSEDDYE